MQIDTRPKEVQLKEKSAFCSNKIRTARYNALTFFPIALLLQYQKVGNVFWTLQLVLQTNKKIRTQKPGLVAILVFLMVGLGMFKEWLSDYRRKKSDDQTNQTPHRRVTAVTSAHKST